MIRLVSFVAWLIWSFPLLITFPFPVHTINYVQNSSSFLFTSILAVSARFTGAPQHPSLHAHAKRLLGIALTEGTCDVPTIQAVTIFVFWKPPEDNNMWLRLGHAIRLAYELDMHKPRQTLLPADEFEARQVLVSSSSHWWRVTIS